MTLAAPATAPANRLGALLQYWRKTRSLSQLALAYEADVSPRHICFLETGRARPSRDMVILLSNVLDVPLRERNDLLLAAGFAPVYDQAPLGAPQHDAVQAALKAILKQQEPFPAVVMNRHWDILNTNAAGERFFGLMLGKVAGAGPANVIRLMFSPSGLRPYVSNWDAVAEALIQRVHRETIGGVTDPATTQLLDEVLSYPGVPPRLRKPGASPPSVPVLPICFQKDGEVFRYFSTVTTLGTPQDVTLQELRIECFFPADDATEQLARSLSLPLA